MKKCPECNGIYPKGDKFCRTCKIDLVAVDNFMFHGDMELPTSKNGLDNIELGLIVNDINELQLGMKPERCIAFIINPYTYKMGFVLRMHFGLKLEEEGYSNMMGKIECFDKSLVVLPSRKVSPNPDDMFGTAVSIIFKQGEIDRIHFSVRQNRKIAKQYYSVFNNICANKWGAALSTMLKKQLVLYWVSKSETLAIGYNDFTGYASFHLERRGIDKMKWY